jgi:glycogen(starch) synthase
MDASNRHTPMRVLMTTDTVGGVWSYSMELCKVLNDFNVRFCLVTMGAPMQPAQRKEVESLANVIVHETDIMLEWMEAPWKSIDTSCDWLLQIESEFQPDIIHLNCFVYGSLPWKAPLIVVAHSDVWSWWKAVKNELPPTEWNEYYNRVSKGLEGADLIVAPSKAMMNYVREIYSAKCPGMVIYNGKSSAAFYPAEKEPFIFSMGRIWDEAKNIQLLVQAASLINYPIRIAGDNSFGGNHVEVAGTNISYLGKLSSTEVAEHLSKASVYVLPARYEPFGLSVLEAALSGCALVLGDIPSLREIWGDSAIYVDIDDANALAFTVNELLDNSVKRKQYAGKAIMRAMGFTTAVMGENYLNVYKELWHAEVALG